MEFSPVFADEEEEGLECQSFERTEEELAEWSTNEDWTEGQKALSLLSKGFALQKRAVLSCLCRLASEPEFLDILQLTLVRLRQRDLPTWEEALQVDAGYGFLAALRAGSLASPRMRELARAAVTLLTTWSPPVHETWLPVFEETVNRLAIEDVKSICVPTALSMGEPSQAVQTRALACSLLPVFAEKMGSHFNADLLHRVKLLSQDPSFEVRKRMATQLPRIAAAVGESVRPAILDEYLKLLTDDELEVRQLSASHLSALLPYFRSSELSHIVATELLSSRDSAIRLSVARAIGKLIASSTDAESQFFAFYVAISADYSDCNLQLAAAEGFPLVFQSALRDTKESELLSMLDAFATCKHETVRVAIARGVHEVVAACSKPTAMMRVVVDLMADSTTRWVVVQRIADTYAAARGDDNRPFWASVQGLLAPSESWRNLSVLVQQVMQMREVWKMSEMLEFVQPQVMRLLREGGWALRLQCLDLLVALIYDNFYQARRLETCVSFTSQFSSSQSYQSRVLYIEFCERIVKTHSKQFFETHFFTPFLSLAGDAIPAVRIRMAEALPRIGKVFSSEERWSSLVSDTLTRLTADSDAEVRWRAFAALKEMGEKEFWEAAKTIEEEDVRKVAREAQQSGREQAVTCTQEKEEEKKKVLQELTKKARYDYLVQCKEKNGSRSSSRSKATAMKLSPAPIARTASASKPTKDRPTPSVPSPKFSKTRPDSKVSRKK